MDQKLDKEKSVAHVPEAGRAFEDVPGDNFPGACCFCGGTIFIPKGASYGACLNCGSI